jgi:hypothetical protein
MRIKNAMRLKSTIGNAAVVVQNVSHLWRRYRKCSVTEDGETCEMYMQTLSERRAKPSLTWHVGNCAELRSNIEGTVPNLSNTGRPELQV